MLLLQTWYNLSDVALEERVNDSITFSRFLGLSLEELSPDHSTISRFRTALTKLGLMDALLSAVNEQLELAVYPPQNTSVTLPSQQRCLTPGGAK